MIFNQKEFESAKSLEAMTDPDSQIYEKVKKIIRDQGFAKTVFLGYTIIDGWEGTPCVFMERDP
jgi:hypothetical protein